jgi:hypothetical protein
VILEEDVNQKLRITVKVYFSGTRKCFRQQIQNIDQLTKCTRKIIQNSVNDIVKDHLPDGVRNISDYVIGKKTGNIVKAECRYGIE